MNNSLRRLHTYPNLGNSCFLGVAMHLLGRLPLAAMIDETFAGLAAETTVLHNKRRRVIEALRPFAAGYVSLMWMRPRLAQLIAAVSGYAGRDYDDGCQHDLLEFLFTLFNALGKRPLDLSQPGPATCADEMAVTAADIILLPMPERGELPDWIEQLRQAGVGWWLALGRGADAAVPVTERLPGYRPLCIVDYTAPDGQGGHYSCHVRFEDGWCFYDDHQIEEQLSAAAVRRRLSDRYHYLTLYGADA